VKRKQRAGLWLATGIYTIIGFLDVVVIMQLLQNRIFPPFPCTADVVGSNPTGINLFASRALFRPVSLPFAVCCAHEVVPLCLWVKTLFFCNPYWSSESFPLSRFSLSSSPLSPRFAQTSCRRVQAHHTPPKHTLLVISTAQASPNTPTRFSSPLAQTPPQHLLGPRKPMYGRPQGDNYHASPPQQQYYPQQGYSNTPPQHPPPRTSLYHPSQQPGGQRQSQYGVGTPAGAMGQQGQGYGGPNGQVRAWFDSVDVDRSGQITERELKRALLNGDMSAFSEDTIRMCVSSFFFSFSPSLPLSRHTSLQTSSHLYFFHLYAG
jgi:hypothetical protein